ncbi:EF-Tu/IF-2/RF-3 family GTPase [Streptomyces xanthophaeus]|uniref:EF-Tu C-terminal domain-related protein n=1 Tax=Streptomyces xanthophaeus TaxID=67385 RepID=UPI0034172BE8
MPQIHDESGQSADLPFLMAIKDVYTLSGRGTVVSGTVEQGTIRRHEAVEIVGLRDTVATTVTSSATFSKGGDVCRAGDEAAFLLRDIQEEEVGRGQVVAAPGSVRSHTSFEADIDFLTAEAGGRTTPITEGYKPQIRVRTAEVPSGIELPEGTGTINPGDTVHTRVTIRKSVALSVGGSFEATEPIGAGDATHTVGRGTITDIIE